MKVSSRSKEGRDRCGGYYDRDDGARQDEGCCHMFICEAVEIIREVRGRGEVGGGEVKQEEVIYRRRRGPRW